MKFYFCECCDHGLDETQLDENGCCWQCGEKPELTAERSEEKMMQKSDSIRRMKWAMEDAFLREVGVMNGRAATSMRSWNEPWEISTKNRDRPGGHMPSRYYHPWKKADKRKARREHRKITAEAVRDFYEDHELYLQEMAALYDDFWDDMNSYVSDHPHYFEDEYDPFWDEKSYQPEHDYDPFWDLCYPV